MLPNFTTFMVSRVLSHTYTDNFIPIYFMEFSAGCDFSDTTVLLMADAKRVA